MNQTAHSSKRRTTTASWRNSRWAALALAAFLAACGGGGGTGETGTPDPASIPETRADAQRFLVQSSFGPKDADTDRVMALGYRGWLEDQFVQPQASHRSYWDAANAEAARRSPPSSAGQREVFDSFYMYAVNGRDQLRQRVAFALSEIFVISMMDGAVGDNPRGVAGYMDTLGANAFGTYRDLLQAVAMHPMMGLYLSHLRNMKEDAKTGRVPDENFAREVMQLFSIGLYQLNPDGSVKTGADNKPIDTYSATDIAGLAKVFTGFSWAGPDTTDNRFYGWGTQDVNRFWTPMQVYPKFHSTGAKAFLGQSIAAGSGDATADLKMALDTLANHPNVGPFFGRQLIQRLVTSNPSPAYVGRVSAAFSDNGSGVRGDMKAVLRAVLMDPEARDVATASKPDFGKVREPVLRMTAFMRAFNATSDTGKFLIGSTDDAGTQLGQSPLRAPSVFNFFRPGYVAPNTNTGDAGLAAPEMQITHETTVVGYANFMRSGVESGLGQNGVDWSAKRRDVQPNYSAELALAEQPAELVEQVSSRLIPDAPATLKAEIEQAVGSVKIPALKADASNQASVDNAKKNRVYIAVYLTLVSPEFIVQK